MASVALKRSYKIQSLAGDLGIKPSGDPVREIVRFCAKKVQRFRRDFPDCVTLPQLLDICAGKLGTKFEEIHSDDDLEEIRSRYVRQGEKAFAGLHDELSAQVYGITFRRVNRKSWELPYVSLIDSRGEKRFRSYYTKWHELGHLLILTDQMRLTFRRTHFGIEDKDPEEALVDVIAGEFAFMPELIRPLAKGTLSFERIEDLRQRLCPDASQQASMIGIAKAWPTPCILLHVTMALKRGEKRALAQFDLGLNEAPKEALRAVQVSANDAGRASNFMIFPNMRIPERSVINRVFAGATRDCSAEENLNWWESSDGGHLPSTVVLVQAQKVWDGVVAILTPIPRN